MKKVKYLFALLTGIIMIPVSCVTEEGTGEESGAVERTTLSTPSDVRIIEAGATEVLVSWNRVADALAYEIYLDDIGEPEMSIDTCALIDGLSPKSSHSIKVAAIAASQSRFMNSALSEMLSFTTTAKPKVRMPEVRIDTLTTGTAGFIWNSVANAGVYKYVFDDGQIVDTADTTLSFSGLTFNKEYLLKVCALPDEESAAVYDTSDWKEVRFTTRDRVVLDVPAVKVESVTAEQALVSWDEISGAGSYEYTFGDSGVKSTSKLSLTLADLEEGAEYALRLRACPSDDNANLASGWFDVTIKVPVVVRVPLDSPAVNVERASSICTIISWDAVENADTYRYVVDSGDTLSTTETSVRFEGIFDKNTGHEFKLQACSDHPKYFIDSEWKTASFTAVYDFASTLSIGTVTATDKDITATFQVSGNEYFYVGSKPLASCMTEDGQIDTAGIAASIKENATESNLRTKSVKYTFNSNIFSETTYVVYAMGIEPDGSVTSKVLTKTIKTSAAETTHSDVVELSGGALTLEVRQVGANSDGKMQSRFYLGNSDSANTQFASMKYTYLGSTNANVTGTEDEVRSKLKAYFKSSGTAASSTATVNGGSRSIYSVALTANAKYCIAACAVTAAGDTLVVSKAVKTYKADNDWITITPSNITSSSASVKIESSLPLKEAKVVSGLSSSTDSREQLATYFETKGSAVSATGITNINAGKSVSYSMKSLTANSTTGFSVMATNIAGDTIIRSFTFKTAKSD